MGNARTSQDLVFGSKLDAFTALVYLFYIGVCALSGMVYAQYGRHAWPGLAVSVVMAPGAVLMVWTLLTTRYRVTDRELIVRSGPWKRTIPLGLIAAVRPVRDRSAAMALALDRVEVRSESGAVLALISPRDRQRFTEEVLRRARAARAT